jgi:hypothetical protein
MVVNWQKAPLGSWASYEMKYPMPYEVKVTLVQRQGPRVTLEYSIGFAGGLVIRSTYDTSKGLPERPAHQVVQRPSFDPMEDPGRRWPSFRRADAAELVGAESLAIDGKAIACKHYRSAGGAAAFNYWVSDSVVPLGIVRITGPAFELGLRHTGTGRAVSKIVGKVRPYDKSGMQAMFTLSGPPTASPAAP